ncbi:hypothetical protein SY88_21410 [Clostridiales bacterium PH28_bin88]|nr:hypothetical protein SY88_21410 [Clostridiales bacterium PH28_bin88]
MVSAVWGLTFVSVKNAMAEVAPFSFNAVRFGLAFLFMLPFCRSSLNRLDRHLVGAGVLLGLFLFGGYSFQTVGLIYTSASNAGFITGLAVVFVPVLVAILSRRMPSRFVTLGVFSATAGLALLTLETGLDFNRGDLLVLLCAFSFAGHIFLVGRYSPRYHTVLLVTVQIGTVSLASAAAAALTEPPLASFSTTVWAALLVTAIPATSLAFLVQNWAQKFTTPTHTALIFAMEPVFAALCAYWLLGERISRQDLLGAVLMLAGILLSEIKREDPTLP